MSQRRRRRERIGGALPRKADPDERFLHACLPDLTTAVRGADLVHTSRLLNRLVAECADRPRMVRNCVKVLVGLVQSIPGDRAAESAAGAIAVGDIVNMAGASAWAGRTGLVVYVDSDANEMSVWVEFHVGSAVHIDQFPLASIHRSGCSGHGEFVSGGLSVVGRG